jgi:hypothetical protein
MLAERSKVMIDIDQFKRRARGVAFEQIDHRATVLGDVVGRHARKLHSLSDSYSANGQVVTADLLASAAQRLHSISTYLTRSDGEQIFRDVESAARDQAIVTTSLGLVGGFLAARFLKATESRTRSVYGIEYTEAFVGSLETPPAGEGRDGFVG